MKLRATALLFSALGAFVILATSPQWLTLDHPMAQADAERLAFTVEPAEGQPYSDHQTLPLWDMYVVLIETTTVRKHGDHYLVSRSLSPRFFWSEKEEVAEVRRTGPRLVPNAFDRHIPWSVGPYHSWKHAALTRH